MNLETRDLMNLETPSMTTGHSDKYSHSHLRRRERDCLCERVKSLRKGSLKVSVL